MKFIEQKQVRQDRYRYKVEKDTGKILKTKLNKRNYQKLYDKIDKYLWSCHESTIFIQPNKINESFKFSFDFYDYILAQHPSINLQDTDLNLEEAQQIIDQEIIDFQVQKPQRQKRQKTPKLSKFQLDEYKYPNELRQIVFKMINLGYDSKDINKFTKLKPREISFLKGQQNKGNFLNKKQGRKPIINDQISQNFRHFIEENQQKKLNYEIFKTKIQDEFIDNRRVANSTIQKLLKANDIKYKTVKYRDTNFQKQNATQNRFEYAIKFIKQIKLKKKFIFVDETSIQLDLQPKKRYIFINQLPVFQTQPIKENVTVIAAITTQEVIGFQMVQKSVKSLDFLIFIYELLQNNREIAENRGDFVFIFDGAKTHFANCIIERLGKAINYIKMSPNSPFLNPIEEIFSIWKAKIKDQINPTQTTLLKKVIQSSKEITNQHVKGFYSHALKYFKLCLNRQEDLPCA